MTIRHGNREVIIEGKTVEDFSMETAAYALPFVGPLLLIADQLSDYADIRKKATIHTDQGDFSAGEHARWRDTGMWRAAMIGLLMIQLILGKARADAQCRAETVAILVDHSGSLSNDFDRRGERWALTAELFRALRSFSPPIRVGLFSFGSRVEEILPFVSSDALPENPPKAGPSLGWSDIGGTLRWAEDALPLCAYLVLLTDGVPQTQDRKDPTSHFPAIEERLRALREAGFLPVVILFALPNIQEWDRFQKASDFWHRMADIGLVALVEFRDPNRKTAIAASIANLIRPEPPPSPTPPPMPTPSTLPALPSLPSPTPGAASSPHSAKGSFEFPPWLGALIAPILFAILLVALALRRGDSPGPIGELIWFSPQGPVWWDLSRELRKNLEVDFGDLDRRLPRGVARLRALPGPQGRVVLQALRSDRIRINEHPPGDACELRDGMQIEIDGTIRLRYENLLHRIRP